MSLKAFHIIFVIIATMLCVFVAVWGFVFRPNDLAEAGMQMGYIGIAGAVIMPIYGVIFYRKVKNIYL